MRGYCHVCHLVLTLLKRVDSEGDSYYVLPIHALFSVRCDGSLERPLLLE